MVNVIGSGGHGKVVISALLASNVSVENVFDDDDTRVGSLCMGVYVKSTKEIQKNMTCVVAVGNNHSRKDVVERFPHVQWASVVHPSALVSDDVTIGPGSVIMAGAVIQPNVTIGAHVIVNTRSSVDHDGVLKDFSNVAPGATLCGTVHLGTLSTIGAGATVREGISIATDCILGMGAALTKDMARSHEVWVGVPATFKTCRKGCRRDF